MKTILILNANLVNENQIIATDILIKNQKIERIEKNLSNFTADIVIDAKENFVLPGVIDDQVHFREPGLTHKAELYTEAKAAVAGGTTSFMEMPNTIPNTLTQELLAQKYQRGSEVSLANYSFFMGVGNDNLEQALKTDIKNVCGLKIFMGSSTGNMLVDNPITLDTIFREANLLIATHCEDETTVKNNVERFKKLYGENPDASVHPKIRNEKACFLSSSLATTLAKKYNTRLHILHLTTTDELNLFTNKIPLAQKRITSEVCVHHLWFSSEDYATLGNQIKCNPAIKDKRHQDNLWKALLDDRLDIIATDHAPHTWEEKQQNYWNSPAGLPLVQFSLVMMLEKVKQGKISIEKVVEKMCHSPAICFQIEKRGFIREGYWADITIVNPNKTSVVQKENIIYKSKWSPLENTQFSNQVTHTIVSGHLAYENGVFHENKKGERLTFERD
ncbi:MAG: dihydroorotase [Bacteroidetes bacterium]|nr:MAG: dihydroorotase [Bacteroidota bacterium]TAG92129.1 MAG: dihydroorotase [Bacteroidota bacterium]